MMGKMEGKRSGSPPVRWTHSVTVEMSTPLEDLKDQVKYRSSWRKSICVVTQESTAHHWPIINQPKGTAQSRVATFSRTSNIPIPSTLLLFHLEQDLHNRQGKTLPAYRSCPSSQELRGFPKKQREGKTWKNWRRVGQPERRKPERGNQNMEKLRKMVGQKVSMREQRKMEKEFNSALKLFPSWVSVRHTHKHTQRHTHGLSPDRNWRQCLAGWIIKLLIWTQGGSKLTMLAGEPHFIVLIQLCKSLKLASPEH